MSAQIHWFNTTNLHEFSFCGLKYRGDGIRTHGGLAPTQPFQDCTLNRSDTPLCFFNYNQDSVKCKYPTKVIGFIQIIIIYSYDLFSF